MQAYHRRRIEFIHGKSHIQHMIRCRHESLLFLNDLSRHISRHSPRAKSPRGTSLEAITSWDSPNRVIDFITFLIVTPCHFIFSFVLLLFQVTLTNIASRPRTRLQCALLISANPDNEAMCEVESGTLRHPNTVAQCPEYAARSSAA